LKKKPDRPAMGLYLIAAGAFLIFNGNYNIIDPLPDLFGWLLVLAGMSRVAAADERFADAVKALRWLVVVTAVRLVLSVARLSDEPNDLLLFTTAFTIFEAFPLRRFHKGFFGGMERVDYGVNHRHAFPLARARAVTAAFFIVKYALNLIPEFIVLLDEGEMGYITSIPRLTLMQAKPSVAIACLIAATLFGAIWLTVLLPMLKAFAADPEFPVIVRKGEVARRFASDPRREAYTAFTLLMSAALFAFVDVTLDMVNIVPDFAIPILALAACAKIKQYVPKETLRPIKIAAVAALALAAGHYVLATGRELLYAYSPLLTEEGYVVAGIAATALYVVTCFSLFAMLILMRKLPPIAQTGWRWIACCAALFAVKLFKIALSADGMWYFLFTVATLALAAAGMYWLRKIVFERGDM